MLFAKKSELFRHNTKRKTTRFTRNNVLKGGVRYLIDRLGKLSDFLREYIITTINFDPWISFCVCLFLGVIKMLRCKRIIVSERNMINWKKFTICVH